MEIDFNETDLLKDVLNLKIVNRKKLEERYGFKRLDYTIEHVNNFLRENNNGIIHKKVKIICITLENIMKVYLK